MSLTFPTTVQYKRRQRPALEVGTLGRSSVYLVQMPPSRLRLVYKEGRRIEGLDGSSYDKVKWVSGPNEGKKEAISTLEAWAQNAESGSYAGSQEAAARYREQITNITGKTAMSTTETDRRTLIRKAASLPVGSGERREILAGLEKTSFVSEGQELADLLGKKWRNVKWDEKRNQGSADMGSIKIRFSSSANDPAVIINIVYTERLKGDPERMMGALSHLQKTWRM